MSNSCNQTPTLSNTAEIVEIKKSFRTTPLQSNDKKSSALDGALGS